MYKAVLNFLRGQVLVHIESGCPERVVNLCAGAEVPSGTCGGCRRWS